jgi:Zn-dependent peptidase ImmA (M78 family)
MTSKTISRTCEDVDEAVLSYAEVKAIASGDPRIKEKLDADMQVSRLTELKKCLERGAVPVGGRYPARSARQIAKAEETAANIQTDMALYAQTEGQEFSITVAVRTSSEREPAGAKLLVLTQKGWP